MQTLNIKREEIAATVKANAKGNWYVMQIENGNEQPFIFKIYRLWAQVMVGPQGRTSGASGHKTQAKFIAELCAFIGAAP